MNNSTDYVGAIKNKWMTGRGTKFLYGAIAVLLWCSLGSAMATSTARTTADVAVKNSLQMAQIYVAACNDVKFYTAHEEHCLMSQRVIADPTKPASPLVEHEAPGSDTQILDK